MLNLLRRIAGSRRRVQSHWSRMAKNPPAMLSWMQSPAVMAGVNHRITGDPDLDWFTYVCRKYLIRGGRGVEYGLTLGCGNGPVERHAFSLGACRRMDAYDVAPGAVEEANRLAAEAGIDGVTYRVADLNTATLPAGRYDVAFGPSAVHHITNLEHLYDQVHAGLKPGGLFVLNEYVGPSQFQFTPKAVGIINELLAVLPSRYRRRSDGRGLKRGFSPPTVAAMNRVDPSEAVRSADVVPLLRERFDVLERKDFGGTINHMLLQFIVHNFDPASDDGRALLGVLAYLEDLLIREKVLESDFTFIVARRRAA